MMEIQEGEEGVEAAVTPSVGRLRLQERQRVRGDEFFFHVYLRVVVAKHFLA